MRSFYKTIDALRVWFRWCHGNARKLLNWDIYAQTNTSMELEREWKSWENDINICRLKELRSKMNYLKRELEQSDYLFKR